MAKRAIKKSIADATTTDSEYKKAVEDVDDRFPQYLQINTRESCANFLYIVCQEFATKFPNDKWGLLSKSPGENGYTWPNGIRTSHDAIVIPAGNRVDIVSGAGSGIPTIPSWNVIPKELWRPANVWMDYNSVNSSAQPIPPPNPNPILPKAFNPYPDENTYWKQFEIELSKSYQEAGVTVAAEAFQAGRWFSRTAYDLATILTPEESFKKHLNEARELLGLPPK